MYQILKNDTEKNCIAMCSNCFTADINLVKKSLFCRCVTTFFTTLKTTLIKNRHLKVTGYFESD